MNLNPLLHFIRKYESSNNYNAVHSSTPRSLRPADLTNMTVSQVMAWQRDRIKRRGMSAAGGYQIIRRTLKEIYRRAGLGLNDKFDEDAQDRLCVILLKRRGLDVYMAGQINTDRFCNNLAKEWASLPLVAPIRGKRVGQSYYAGDGVNKSHVSVEEFKAAVRAIK